MDQPPVTGTGGGDPDPFLGTTALKPMRLAFLTHEPFHPPTGGGSAEARRLVEEFRRRGHEVEVFAPDGEDRAGVEQALGIRWHVFRSWRMGRFTRWRTLKYLLYPAALARMVRRVNAGAAPFDALFCQHTIASVAGGMLKRRLGWPVVMNFLDFLTGFVAAWPAFSFPRLFLGPLNRFEVTLPVRARADGVLTVSESLARRLIEAGYPAERTLPIQYGYDARAFAFRETDVARRLQGPPVVVMHGSFDQHHLGPVALETMSRVHALRPDVRFRLVGRLTPALRRFLAQAGARGLTEAIEHRPFVPYDQVADALRDGRVGLVPYEGTPGTHCAFVAKAVEYLGLGMPVASTRLEAIAAWFRDEPLIRFADFTGEALAAAVVEWLEAPADRLAAWGRAAAARTARELDWPVVAARAVDFVEPLLGSKPTENGA
ncbi:MAG: glycosyltransferase [Verrucomicrobia bacterium]|nr:MAG: glycosyltransferase [Verrucomicrobiota bacterium]